VPEVQEPLYRPYLAMAILCERVLREADGVISVIRVFDRSMVTGPTEEMPPTNIPLTLVISFKSGFMRGKGVVRLNPKSPSGKDLPGLQFPVLFEGDDDRGIAIVATLGFLVQEEGLYWFDVLVQEEVVTRIPLRVLYQRVGYATPQS